MGKYDFDRMSEDTLRKLVGSLSDSKVPIFLVEDGKVLFANSAWLDHAPRLYENIEAGLSVKESLLHEVENIAPHLDSDIQKLISEQFAKTVLKGGTYEFGAPDGKLFRGSYSTSENNGSLGISFDITELKQKRAELRKSKVLIESILEGLPHGVLLYDDHGKVVYCNEGFRSSAFEMGVEIKTGMHYKDVGGQLSLDVQKIFADTAPGDPFEVVQTGINERSYLTEGVALEGLGFLVSTVDITELQTAMEAARSADKAKTSFLANMSHEIRTPMNGVLGMAQVLEQSDISDHQKNCVRIIKESSEMLLRIINDILDISKLDAEKIELDVQSINIEDTIKSAIEIVKPKLNEKPNLEIIFDMPVSPISHHLGDPDRIRQVLVNLIGNGIKFTEDGHVKVTADIAALNAEYDTLKIRIEDTGVGIDKAHIDRIFERFEQSDNSTTRRFGGTGLGLAISRKLADIMGGDLSVCTEQTQGACFDFTISLQKCQAPKQIMSTSGFQTFPDVPVLIIDDNDVNHMVLTSQLKPLKVKTFCLSSADKGLSILRRMAETSLRMPLVICDFKMPKKSGYDFVKELRADPLISETPVIIISSADLMFRRKEFQQYGVDYVLEKPCSNHEILDAVSRTLKQSTPLTQSTMPEVSKSSARSVPALNSKRILVADDDPVNRDVFKGMLNLQGYEPVIVSNGLEALQRYEKEEFDLVLMDVSMPVLNGLEATEKIRRLEKRIGRAETPIIAVTAHALKGDKEKFLASGMNDYLSKPILKADIEKLTENWINLSTNTVLAS